MSHPQGWLDDLNNALSRTLCKHAEQPISLGEGLEEFGRILLEIRRRERDVWWVGNGGSSALCSHLSQDVLNKLKIRSHVFSDASMTSCFANDYGYPQVYAKPLQTLARPEDLLIAISSSGKSENILNSVRVARGKEMKVVTLSGFSETNPLWQVPADLAFFLPAALYGQVEVGHEALLHSTIETLFLRETASQS